MDAFRDVLRLRAESDWRTDVMEALRPALDTGDSRTADDKAVAIYAILAAETTGETK